MLLSIFNRTNLLRFGFLSATGIAFTACSGLNQQVYDVDGIYNNSKIVVEDTHENNAYYTAYFKDKSDEMNEYFTDIENYSSNYKQANGAWGDTTSETQIVYNYPYSSFAWGGYPYYGGGYYDWGWSFGFGGGYWGSPFYGWGYPYYGYGFGYPYYGYGWGAPYYGWSAVSRNNSYRALNARSINRNVANRLNGSNVQRLQRNSFRSTRNALKPDRTFSRANSSLSRFSVSDHPQRNNTINRSRTIRNDRFNNNTRFNNTNRNTNMRPQQRTSRPMYTPSSPRMNTGSMGGMRGGSMGGMRMGGGRR